MCVAELNVSTLPCRHRWYHLLRSCSLDTNLGNCPRKLCLEGWETKCDFCPYCDSWNHISNAEFHLIGDDRHPSFSGRFLGLDSSSLRPLTTTALASANRTTARMLDIQHQQTTTSIWRSQRIQRTAEENRAMNDRLAAYLRPESGLTTYLLRPESELSEDDPLPSISSDSFSISSDSSSIFSKGTVASSWSTSTQTSKEKVASSADFSTFQLAETFATNKHLQPLYKEAIQSDRIGPEAFEHTFEKLLREYSKELEEEAGESPQYFAAQKMRQKVREVTDAIITRYTTVEYRPVTKQVLHGTGGHPIPFSGSVEKFPKYNPPNDRNNEMPRREGTELIFPVGEFLTQGIPFENLKRNFEAFVRLSLQTEQSTADSEEPGNPISSVALGNANERYSSLKTLLVKLCLLERPLQPGKQRVRWKCCCGKEICDDYVELRQGALDELTNRLQYLAVSQKTRYSGSNAISNCWNIFARINSTISNVFSKRSRNTQADSGIPLHNSPFVDNGPVSNPSNAKPEPVHLLLCMKEGRFGTSLHQEDICGIDSDKSLFQQLKMAYKRHRGNLFSVTSLCAPEGIDFVMFNVVTGKTVTLRRCNSQTCTCLPPPNKVEPEPNAEYRCNPISTGLCPPIGPDTLMHLLQHPEHIENVSETRILEQFPKKIHGELAGPVLGWGVYFKEGWNWELIKVILLVYIVGSLVFGVAWWAGKEDIQGALGVASYMVNIATAFLAYIAVGNL